MLAGDRGRPTIRARGRQAGMLAPPREAFADTGAGKTTRSPTSSSRAEYFDVLDIPIVRGRSFTAAEPTTIIPVVIVSESMARALWPNGSGVGETFRLEPDPEVGTQVTADEPPMPLRALVTVVGVSRDVPGFRFTDHGCRHLFLPTSAHAPNTSIVARVSGRSRAGPADARSSISPGSIRTWARSSPCARWQARDVLPADRLLGVAGARRARAGADGVGAVQRAVVSRRAAHQGDRRANGARRLVARR
jgi:hypothetical protein